MRLALAFLAALTVHGIVLAALTRGPVEPQLPPGFGWGDEMQVSPAAAASPERRQALPAVRLLVVSANPAVSGFAVSASQGQYGGGDSYLGLVRAYLNGQARQQRLELPGGVAEVKFEVGPEGEVSHIQLSASSGHAELDAAALALLRQSAPLPKPPLPMRLRVPIEFHP